MDISVEALRDCFFFSGLNDNDLLQVFGKLQRVDLSENEYLFKERDQGDSLYVLIKGKLAAATQHKSVEKVIGFIRPGEVVGELNIFSNAPRSASVKAIHPSIVLRLSHEDFQSLCYKNPKILWEVSQLIARRSQSNMEILREGKTSQSQLIAIVSVGQQMDIQKLMSDLAGNSNETMNISFIDYSSLKADRHLIHSGRTIIYGMDYAELHKNSEVLQLSDKVVFAINAEHDNYDSLKKIWDECVERPTAHMERELMLLQTADKPFYLNTQKYFGLANFSKWYHVAVQSPKTVQRFLRLLSGNAIGVVIGGGGARGWAAAGAIKALLDHNIAIDYIGGSSIGAVVGCMYALSENYEQFMGLGKTMGNPVKLHELTWPLVSIFSGAAPTEWTQGICGDVMISDFSVPYFAMSTNLSTMSEHIWDRGFLWQALRATGSAPMLVPPLTYNNQLHVDGGVLNNFPVDVMHAKLENRGFVIGIDITRSSLDVKAYDFPPTIKFWKALQMKIKGDAYIDIVETMDRTMMATSMEKTVRSGKRCDLLIRPKLDEFGLLDFAKKDEILERGYKEADEQLSKFFGLGKRDGRSG